MAVTGDMIDGSPDALKDDVAPLADLRARYGGHLFFLKWLISAFNGGLVNGLYEVDGTKLYVSPGTGIWSGFSCRLGVPAEITHIILRSQAKG